MRFQRLHLKTYGVFSDRLLEFNADGHDFHAIYGRNEAGKTTTLRALSDFLFGFGHLTADDFQHDASALRVGAVIQSAAGDLITVYRRKGRAGTLLDADDQKVDDTALDVLLGSMHRDLFQRLFGLDHGRLRAGGEDIEKFGGDVGLSMFEAGAGLVGIRGVLDSFRQEADAIFKPRGQTQSLNAAISRYREARSRIRAASLSADKWHQTYSTCRQLEIEQEALEVRLRDRQKSRVRLERIHRNLGDLARRRKVKETLLELAAVPDLRPGFAADRSAAQEAMREAQRDLARAREETARIQSELDAIHIPGDLLAREQDIEALYEERASVRKALADLPERRAEFQSVETQIKDNLRQADLRLTAEQAQTALPTKPVVARIRSLVKRYEPLSSEASNAETAMKEAAAELESLQQSLSSTDVPPDVSPLVAALDDVNEQGRLDSALSDAVERVRQTEEELGNRMAALPLWSGTAGDLARLAVPSEKTVDRFERRFRETNTKRDAACAAVAAERERVAELVGDMREFVAAGDIPTEAIVGEARAHRDRGWRLIRRAYIDSSEDVASEAAAFDPQRPLPEAYEHSIAKVDRLADELHAGAERVARYKEMESAHRRALERLATAEAAETLASEQVEALTGEWRGHWETLGIVPLSPLEMGAWLRQRADVLTLLNDQRDHRLRVDGLKRSIDEARRTLIAALTALGEGDIPETEPLPALVRRCRTARTVQEKRRSDRVRLMDRFDEVTRKTERERQRLDRSRGVLSAWQEQWRDAVAALSRPETISTEEAEAVLDLIDDVRKLLVRWSGLRYERIEAMEDDIARYDERVRSVTPPDLNEFPAVEAIRMLFERLQEGRKLRERHEQLAASLEREVTIARQAETALTEASESLRRLCVEAGCDTHESLEPLERKAEAKSQNRRVLDEIENALLQQNPGRDLDSIEAEAATEDPDGLPGRIEALDREISDLSSQRVEMAGKIGEISNQISAMDGGDSAASAAQDAEAELARIRQDAARYIRHRVAIALLKRAVDAYRDRNQGPLLTRASALFADLTCASFLGLITDLDDRDQPVLRGLRPNGGHLGVEAMSDGTLDQLYLAIRIAAIEAYLERNEPMPLVLDDILINFDNDRAAATLRVLSDLSRRTQVLFFTHHAHLVHMAEETLGVGAVAVHELIPTVGNVDLL